LVLITLKYFDPIKTLKDYKIMSTNTSHDTASQGTRRDATQEKIAAVADSAASTICEAGSYYVAEPAKDVFSLLREYSKDKPDVAAMWAFGVGIMIGWRLRR